MKDVRPLDSTSVLPIFPPFPELPPTQESPRLSPKPPPPQPRAPGGVDRATVERLKRGQINIEARIDLHGLDQRQAFADLMCFIEASTSADRRAILVITGKGAVGGGVLRRNVPGWLMSSPLAGRILTVQQAHPRHGGNGALYVLLRRKPYKARAG
jgi:DNA-nicking Smr family endonuclease